MLDLTRRHESAVFLQPFDDVFVSIFHVLAFEIRDRIDEFAYLVQGANNLLVTGDDSGGQADTIVVLSKVRSLRKNKWPCKSRKQNESSKDFPQFYLVNNSGTTILCYIVITQDPESSLSLLVGLVLLEVGEYWLVAFVLESGPLEL